MSAYWHGGRILYALARYYDWWSHRMMTQFEIDGGIADLVFVTKAGYLTEIEIKVSVSDWNADKTKKKWAKARPHVHRFFYAIPETLENKIPSWIPESAGILVCRRNGDNFDTVGELRPAGRLPNTTKVTDRHLRQITECTYYRFWRKELHDLMRRLWP